MSPVEDETLDKGSLIATMTDHHDQAKYAKLFAGSPQMLAALQLVSKACQYAELENAEELRGVIADIGRTVNEVIKQVG